MKVEENKARKEFLMEQTVIEKLFNKDCFRAKRKKMDAENTRKAHEVRSKYGNGFDDELA